MNPDLEISNRPSTRWAKRRVRRQSSSMERPGMALPFQLDVLLRKMLPIRIQKIRDTAASGRLRCGAGRYLRREGNHRFGWDTNLYRWHCGDWEHRSRLACKHNGWSRRERADAKEHGSCIVGLLSSVGRDALEMNFIFQTIPHASNLPSCETWPVWNVPSAGDYLVKLTSEIRSSDLCGPWALAFRSLASCHSIIQIVNSQNKGDVASCILRLQCWLFPPPFFPSAIIPVQSEPENTQHSRDRPRIVHFKFFHNTTRLAWMMFS